jgi:hypothetical protein
MDPSNPTPSEDVVHLDDEREVANWTKSLGISREDLERAVAAVGPSTGAVYDYIGRNRGQLSG